MIDRNNEYDVNECNRLARALEMLRRMHVICKQDEHDEYDALFEARCCIAIRIDVLRDRIAYASAPWFKV